MAATRRWSCVAWRPARLRDGQRPLLRAPDDPELERRLERGESVLQVIGVADVTIAGLDDEVADLESGRGRRAALFDATDQDPVTLREADRPSQPTRDVVRGDGDAEALPLRGLAATQRIDPGLEGGIGGQGQVEALADRFVLIPTSFPSPSTSAPPDEPGARGAVCSMLPAIRRPPGPRNARSIAETSPNVTRTPPPRVEPTPKTGSPTLAADPLDHSIA
jgi:hypothetical protein